MTTTYHVAAGLAWRAVLVLIWPLAWLGWDEPALWAAFHVLYHDERTA